MTYDRPITIFAAGSRRATLWQPQTLLISELYERLKTPARSTETHAEYMAMKKPQQDDLKDVGGYVLGQLRGGRRKAGAVIAREVLTLDIDNVRAGGADDILARVDSLGCGYCVYSTRKHCAGAPRLRVLLPLDRAVTADEYGAIARRAAWYIDSGMTPFDPSTFEPSRLMFWPSCCSDGEYIYRAADKPFLSADGALASYDDWHDYSSWPQVPGAGQSHARLAAKQGDPTAKSGVVGAFCRVYDVPAAMDKFLPGVYAPCGEGRFTFVDGSTTGGAVLYDDGKFLYSHHATDPCGGKLVNAFDLVRLHIFGDNDDDAKPDTPSNRLPSYTEMTRLALADPDVTALMDAEKYNALTADFGGSQSAELVAAPERPAFDRTEAGGYAKTIKNVLIILEYDPAIAGRIMFNEFDYCLVGLAPLPWNKRKAEQGLFTWEPSDDAGLVDYCERALKIKSDKTIENALIQYVSEHTYNPVKDYLEGLTWDGVPRVDTLLIDYLGAADNSYTRAAIRKSLCAAVARAFCPGTKFDFMTILAGAQGIGKSTLLRILGRDRFTDGITTFEGKNPCEIIRGQWIVEIGELDAMNRTDTDRVKQFLSQNSDRYREAYGKRAQDYPRRCVFFGTTNSSEFLRDATGGRRFWPVDLDGSRATKSVFTQLEGEVDQIWAEAVALYRAGERLYMEGITAELAQKAQEGHREISAWEGRIEEFIEQPVPVDWQAWPLQRRLMYWGGGASGVELTQRTKICAAEIWQELLGGEAKHMRRQEAKEINAILSRMPGWERAEGPIRIGAEYGKQRGFKRAGDIEL